MNGSSVIALLSSLPWCCVLPAGLALMGLAGAGTARLLSLELMPYLLGVSALFLGRAHYLVHVRRQGAPWARRTVWMATGLVVVMWLPRLQG